jgi:hypothetical protein
MTVKSMIQTDGIGSCSYVICVGQHCVDAVRKGCDSLGLKSDLRMFVETANLPIIGVDAEGLVNEWNSRIAMISGLACNEIIGRNFIQVRTQTLILEGG